MKKLIGLVLIITLSFYSCSSDDDSVSSSETRINPPTWIQGTWLLENPNSGYEFTNDDFCLIILTTQTCFKESISQTNSNGGTTNVTEITTDNSYSIEITLETQTVYYEFEKISETEIEWINDPLGDLATTIYVKQ
ncbi:hypothetical protein [Psychroserpens sp. NJDZ02]|uniref:hypothetical protein n=1 Tax=Psychroserpens sp. NJDZ02 TaxID=2570561 RepID=UPI0010A933B4|nr:hypothetical protein [Psychroserpens sp. NJDZ02]QCE41367.1 hypothetical protein E9099_08050 [Psychroserpens sp. NJDZ02]